MLWLLLEWSSCNVATPSTPEAAYIRLASPPDLLFFIQVLARVGTIFELYSGSVINGTRI